MIKFDDNEVRKKMKTMENWREWKVDGGQVVAGQFPGGSASSLIV